MNLKLDEPNELVFILQACQNCSIKAKDAIMVSKVMAKLQKLYEKIESEQPQQPEAS